MKVTARVLIGLLVTAVACGGDDDGPTNPPGNDGIVTASVTGQANYTSNGVVASYLNNVLTITSVQAQGSNSRGITILLTNVTGPNVYSLTLAGHSATYSEITGGTALSWLTAISQGTGSVSITSIQGLHIIGDFSFTAPANTVGGATGTRIITSGHFDILASNLSY